MWLVGSVHGGMDGWMDGKGKGREKDDQIPWVTQSVESRAALYFV